MIENYKNMNNTKIDKIYVYNRLSKIITECEITEIDNCRFAKFIYNYGSYDTWHYDLKGSYVQYLDGNLNIAKPYILVCPDIVSLNLIQESDNRIHDDYKQELINYINRL